MESLLIVPLCLDQASTLYVAPKADGPPDQSKSPPFERLWCLKVRNDHATVILKARQVVAVERIVTSRRQVSKAARGYSQIPRRVIVILSMLEVLAQPGKLFQLAPQHPTPFISISSARMRAYSSKWCRAIGRVRSLQPSLKSGRSRSSLP